MPEGYAKHSDDLVEYLRIGGTALQYKQDPVGYAREMLGVRWWAKQREIAEALLTRSRVFVKASHAIGKTHLSGGLVNWFFDCHNPGIVKTTAPTKNQVEELTWREVRVQRRGKDMMPKAPMMQGVLHDGGPDPNHYAKGYTARDAESFQGTHENNLLIIFEEAVGVDRPFWLAADGMLSSGDGNKWLAMMNPTDITSAAYQAEMSGLWHVISVSALDHPNIWAELRKLPRPFPRAVSLGWVEGQLEENCEEIAKTSREPGDLQWPPQDFVVHQEKLDILVTPKYYRPNAEFEGRVLGRWPSQPMDSIWSESLWAVATKPPDSERLWKESQTVPCEIGCDRARFGDDFTSIHVRRGSVSLYHETNRGMDTTKTLWRLTELANEYGWMCGVSGKDVLVKVDDFGGGVVDPAKRDGWNFVEVNAASRAHDPERYKNRRSELWFATRDRAKAGRLDLSRLPADVLERLRLQVMAPRWAPNSANQRVVEDKSQTKKRVKRSPDDADALNLAYSDPPRELEFWIS